VALDDRDYARETPEYRSLFGGAYVDRRAAQAPETWTAARVKPWNAADDPDDLPEDLHGLLRTSGSLE
jgi:hypothetical protein